MRVLHGAALLACALLLQVASAQAAEQEVRIGPRVGPGQLRIRGGETIGDNVVENTVEEETIGVGGTLEYRAPFGLVLEGGGFRSGSTDWWDDEGYQLSEYFGSIGYQFEFANGLSLIPRVGRARWKLEANELWFFDSDEPNPATRGYQNYWEITGFKRISKNVTLGVSYKENDYDFGRGRAAVFTAMFNL